MGGGGTFITIARRQPSHQQLRFLSSSTPPPDSNLHLHKRNPFSFPSVYSRQAELLFFEASKRHFLFPHLDVSSCPSADASSDCHTPRMFPHSPDGLPFAFEVIPCFERLLPRRGSPWTAIAEILVGFAPRYLLELLPPPSTSPPQNTAICFP